MRLTARVIMILLLTATACGGEKDIPLTGTVTLTNELYEPVPYYSLGFLFSVADRVSTNSFPGPDVTVESGILEGGSAEEAFLSANTLEPSFYLVGTFNTESEAVDSFNTLTAFSVSTWQDFGSPLDNNQVWIIRTRDEKYAKLRIINVLLDTGQTPDFASCTFEWVFQPDGTKTFPGQK